MKLRRQKTFRIWYVFKQYVLAFSVYKLSDTNIAISFRGYSFLSTKITCFQRESFLLISNVK